MIPQKKVVSILLRLTLSLSFIGCVESSTESKELDYSLPEGWQVFEDINTATLKELVDQVGEEFGLEHGPRDKWFNDSISFIGLQSKSNTIVFQHSHLILKAADWHEMLAHKLTAYRGARDINDAEHFLKEIKPKDKQAIFRKTSEYRPFVPSIADKVFEIRFNQIWDKVYGKS